MDIKPTQLNVSQEKTGLQVRDIRAGTFFRINGSYGVYMKVINTHDGTEFREKVCHAINLNTWTLVQVDPSHDVQYAKSAEINVKF